MLDRDTVKKCRMVVELFEIVGTTSSYGHFLSGGSVAVPASAARHLNPPPPFGALAVHPLSLHKKTLHKKLDPEIPPNPPTCMKM